jgi:hypothetical protein
LKETSITIKSHAYLPPAAFFAFWAAWKSAKLAGAAETM